MRMRRLKFWEMTPKSTLRVSREDSKDCEMSQEFCCECLKCNCGAAKPPGESLLPYRWPRKSKIGRNPKKVNSLVYKDYEMVEHEDGTKTYVSPEEKAQLLLEGKIKAAKSKSLPKKLSLKLKPSDSDSEEGYETPVIPQKPKSCENLDTCVKPDLKRMSSMPEMSPCESSKINLPPFIVPVETSLTYPMSKKKNKNKRKTVGSGDENEITPENDLTELRNKKLEDDAKKRFSLKPSINLWPRANNKENGFKEKEEIKPRFSFPWGKQKEQAEELNLEEKKPRFSFFRGKQKEQEEEEESHGEVKEEKKLFAFKLPKLSWKREKKEKLGVDEVDSADKEESEKESEDEKEPFQRRDVYVDTDFNDNEKNTVVVEEPKEIFPTRVKENLVYASDPGTQKFDIENRHRKKSDDEISNDGSVEVEYRRKPPNWSTFPVSKEVDEFSKSEEFLPEEKKYSSDGDISDGTEKLPKPDWSTFPLAMGIKTIDRNPLADYFKNKELVSDDDDKSGEIRISITEDKTRRLQNNLQLPQKYKPMKKIDSNPLKNIFSHTKKNGKKFKSKSLRDDDGDVEDNATDDDDDGDGGGKRKNGVTPSGFETNIHPGDIKTKYGGSGEVDKTSSRSGSDTESADHASADKSSMSKLTSEKQPKKLMSGLFGSFKLGKTKDKVADNEPTKNPASFEVTIKEEPEDIKTESPRSERIVYAELDMARSQGNVMRRDDDKTEYAEIIYPGSKATAEKAMEELRKSRENLALSRENLTEVDEAYTTTPDGKKEAAV